MVMICLLFAAEGSMAQDLKATADAVYYELQIIELQATLDALTNPTIPDNSPVISDDDWNWDTDVIEYTATPAPESSIRLDRSTMIVGANFPGDAYPPFPYEAEPIWSIPENDQSTVITVGRGGSFSRIADAVKSIPNNAGNVTISLVSDTYEPQSGITIPLDKQITSLKISSNDGSRRTVHPENEKLAVWILCNGIPLIVDRNVNLAQKSIIMGGSASEKGRSVQVPSSTIIINGSANWVYAGGLSDYNGQNSTVNEALVIVNGSVDRVFAGGRSVSGNTFVLDSTVVVSGYADEMYCGGYTEYYYSKAIVGKANMKLYGNNSVYGLGRGGGDSILLDPKGCF